MAVRSWSRSVATSVLVAAIVFGVVSAHATTYYLSPSGSDDNVGTSESAAFGTIDHAVLQVHSKGSKDELVILPGEYLATNVLSMSGQSDTDLSNADVVRSSTRNPADVVIYGDGTINLMNLARCVVVEGITFSNGVATAAGSGGGVRVGSQSETFYPSLLTNCVITCCRADTSVDTVKAGGGAYLFCNGRISDCVIENCAATVGRGAAGVFINNTRFTPTLEGTTIRNCISTNCNESCGGGIAIGGTAEGVVTIADCVISNCTSEGKGGGAYMEISPGSKVSGTTFAKCKGLRGGAVLLAAGSVEFENCAFTENTTTTGADNGGGVHVTYTAVATFKDCQFTGNAARLGGALYSGVASQIFAYDCQFSGNSATSLGGAMFTVNAASAVMSNCVFASNAAVMSGGAVACKPQTNEYSSVPGVIALTNCVFVSNTASINGGAISGYAASDEDNEKFGMYGEIYGCVFTNNSAEAAGGAFYHRDSVKNRGWGKKFVIRNSLFAYNKVTTSGDWHCGGGVYLLSYEKPVVDSCTIACNDVSFDSNCRQYGAGFYNRWSVCITNTIIACNTMNGELEGENDWIRGDVVSVSHCCVYPKPAPGSGTSDPFTTARGCVEADPKFANAANGDFTLGRLSPCKHTALLEDWMAGATDLVGNPRVFGAGPDMGCYEFIYPLGLNIILR